MVSVTPLQRVSLTAGLTAVRPVIAPTPVGPATKAEEILPTDALLDVVRGAAADRAATIQALAGSTPELQKAVAAAAQSAVVRQTGLAPLMADLAEAAGQPALPPALRQAAAQVLAQRIPLTPGVQAADVQEALARSGLLMEARIADGGPTPSPQTDLKAALLALRQTLQAVVANTAGASPRPAGPPGAPGAPAASGPAAPGVEAPPAQSGGPSLDPVRSEAPPPATTGAASDRRPIGADVAPPRAGPAPPTATLPETAGLPALATQPRAAPVQPQVAGALFTPDLAGPQPDPAASVPQEEVVPAEDSWTAPAQARPVTGPPASPPQLRDSAGATPTLRGAPLSAGQAAAAPTTVAPTNFLMETALGEGDAAPTSEIAALVLKQALQTFLAGAPSTAGAPSSAKSPTRTPPPPFRGGPTQGQAPVDPDLPAAAGAAARRLLTETEGALARQQLMQVASLPQPHDSAGPATRWMFEAPFATPQGTAVAQFEIARDPPPAGAADAAPTWRARFSINLEPLGPLHAHVSLSGDHIGVALWAERAAGLNALRDQQPSLTKALLAARLSPDVAVYPGQPVSAQAAPGHFVDRAL